MRHFLLFACLTATTGCATSSTFVHSDATLGRVVVYRNGVAYFERTAHVEGDGLSLSVPADKVNDFLKSLTVVDAKTGDAAPVSYPTTAPSSETGLIDMKIGLRDSKSRDLRLSYVTESPSWKPSYRVVLGKTGKVSVQAWAIVDNTSGEDWQNVQLGVGSSSALSFRFDLQSIRTVARETLQSDDLFAQAPPMGGASFDGRRGNEKGGGQRVLLSLADDQVQREEIRAVEAKKDAGPAKTKAPPQPTSAASGSRRFLKAPAADGAQSPSAPPAAPTPPSPLVVTARAIQNSKQKFLIEGYADPADEDKPAASLDRANRAREQLIRYGVNPSQIVAVGKGEQGGRAGGVAVVEAPSEAPAPGDSKPTETATQGEPIGVSHFESKTRTSVPRGTSAMVSILSTDTDGEVVYLYDAESARGNASFPFRSIRLKNPTDSVLESGPVTVFGEGKFIGEGLSEPIPAHSTAFVPFALDRQIMVDHKDSTADRIARIITVQRGVFSTEVQHTKRTILTLHNRMAEPATVYIRHTTADGYRLTKAPEHAERLGASHLFRVDVPPNGKNELTIEEATPVLRTTDIRSPEGMDLVSAYISSAAMEGSLKTAVGELLKLHKDMANIEQQIETTREAMKEYRARMDELHAQVVTLKVVKTAGPLMQSLERKLSEVSDRLSKATIDLVGLQEKLMVARVKFQDGVADLSLEKKADEKG